MSGTLLWHPDYNITVDYELFPRKFIKRSLSLIVD